MKTIFWIIITVCIGMIAGIFYIWSAQLKIVEDLTYKSKDSSTICLDMNKVDSTVNIPLFLVAYAMDNQYIKYKENGTYSKEEIRNDLTEIFSNIEKHYDHNLCGDEFIFK